MTDKVRVVRARNEIVRDRQGHILGDIVVVVCKDRVVGRCQEGGKPRQA